MADKVAACRTMLREVLAPLVERDGGELYLVHLDKKKVHLHVGGTLSGSPAVDVVRDRVFAPVVEKVHPKARLEVSSGWLVPDGGERIRPEAG
ncbi:MAG: NifU family protein [Myxococcota bacterium]